MKDRRWKLITAVSLLFSILVIAYVVWQTNWSVTQDAFTSLNWFWFALALIVYLLNYALRTMRFRLLLYSERVPFLQLLTVTSLYGMYNYLLPAKSGEISYPILLKSRLKIPLSESVSILIVARLLDFTAIALFLPIVLIVFWQELPAWLAISSLIFSATTYVTVGIGRWLLRKSQTSSFELNDKENKTWVDKARRSMHNLLTGLQLIDNKGYWQLLLITIGIWLCVYTTFFLILLSLGYPINYFQIIVVSIIMVPLTLLPLQGFANLGTHEIGWVVAFRIFGYSEEIALSIAVGSHAVLLLFVLFLGAAGFLLGQFLTPKATNEAIK